MWVVNWLAGGWVMGGQARVRRATVLNQPGCLFSGVLSSALPVLPVTSCAFMCNLYGSVLSFSGSTTSMLSLFLL